MHLRAEIGGECTKPAGEPYLQRFSQVLGLSGSTFAAMRRSLRRLLDRAGLRGVDEIVAGLAPDADRLTQAIDDAEELLRAAVTQAGSPG